jgi:hypothetical protein
MNNSFPRLIDGMIEALRQNVLPATEGELARGQIFGVIYLLKNLRLRAGWSPDFLGEQLAALEELRVALERIDGLPAEAPRPVKLAERAPGSSSSVAEMERARDAGDARVCELIDWQAAQTAKNEAVDRAVDAYLRRQLRHELTTSAKPMFAEISLGREMQPTETK